VSAMVAGTRSKRIIGAPAGWSKGRGGPNGVGSDDGVLDEHAVRTARRVSQDIALDYNATDANWRRHG